MLAKARVAVMATTPKEQDSPMLPPMPEEGDDTDNQFGLTGKQNPYVIELSRTE